MRTLTQLVQSAQALERQHHGVWTLLARNAYRNGTQTVHTPPGNAEAVRPGRAVGWAVAADGLTWTVQIQDLPDPHIVAADLEGPVNNPA